MSQHSTPSSPRSSGVMGSVNTFLEQWIPSAMTFALVLTLIVALLALFLTSAGPTDIVRYWGNGLSGLLAFMAQMCLILLLGHMLANTGPVRKMLSALARIPSSPVAAYVSVFVISAVLSLFVWGLGLIAGAVLAREVAVQGRERGIKLHFPLLVAAGYSGFVVWHMGYSASGPLTAATEGSFLPWESPDRGGRRANTYGCAQRRIARLRTACRGGG